MKILDQQEIKRKIHRLALEILEHNWEADILYIGGINNNGFKFAQLVVEQIRIIKDIELILFRATLSPAAPLSSPVIYDLDPNRLAEQHVILIDDVANTGRTLFYATQPLMQVIPSSLEMAVLVDRKHKQFPMHVDYVGLSLATTLGSDIAVHLSDTEEWNVLLS